MSGEFEFGGHAWGKNFEDAERDITVRKVAAFMQVPEELLQQSWPAPPEITRRERLRYRWWDFKVRLSLAWEVLRGRHDCGDYL